MYYNYNIYQTIGKFGALYKSEKSNLEKQNPRKKIFRKVFFEEIYMGKNQES